MNGKNTLFMILRYFFLTFVVKGCDKKNCLPVKNIGIDMKKPPTAQTRLTLDF